MREYPGCRLKAGMVVYAYADTSEIYRVKDLVVRPWGPERKDRIDVCVVDGSGRTKEMPLFALKELEPLVEQQERNWRRNKANLEVVQEWKI